MSESGATTGKKSLVTKLSEVMKEVGRLEKTGYNEHFKYKYLKESDLVEKLSALLADRHIFITSSVKSVETVEVFKVVPKTGQVVTTKMGVLRVEYTFHDGDSGEKLVQEGAGEIEQDGGKGLYKAITGSMKYFLMKNFLVATGDDPEQYHKAEPVLVTTKAPAKKAKVQPTRTVAMEQLTKCKAVQPLTTVYDALMKYTWPPLDLTDLNDCFVNRYAHIADAPIRQGDTLLTKDQKPVAVVRTDEKGKVTIETDPKSLPEAPPPAPKTEPTEEEVVKAEDDAKKAT